MEREKQIDEEIREMAIIMGASKDYCEAFQCNECPLYPCFEYKVSENLYKQGYKKIVMCCECKYCEVVIDSIIDEPKYFCTRMVGCMPIDPTDYCSRAKMKGTEQ